MKKQLHSLVTAIFAVAGLLMAAVATAATPYFSGPSIAKLAAGATFSGKGFAPNAAVTVMVRAPNGAEAGFSAVAAADGSFTYKYMPTIAGVYAITVTDSSGKALAKAIFNARQ